MFILIIDFVLSANVFKLNISARENTATGVALV